MVSAKTAACQGLGAEWMPSVRVTTSRSTCQTSGCSLPSRDSVASSSSAKGPTPVIEQSSAWMFLARSTSGTMTSGFRRCCLEESYPAGPQPDGVPMSGVDATQVSPVVALNRGQALPTYARCGELTVSRVGVREADGSQLGAREPPPGQRCLPSIRPLVHGGSWRDATDCSGRS